MGVPDAGNPVFLSLPAMDALSAPVEDVLDRVPMVVVVTVVLGATVVVVVVVVGATVVVGAAVVVAAIAAGSIVTAMMKASSSWPFT